MSCVMKTRRNPNPLQPNAAYLTEMARLIDAGKLQPVVSQVLPLVQVREAHRFSESGHGYGKIVLVPG